MVTPVNRLNSNLAQPAIQKVLLVSSTGGHFRALQRLEGYWSHCDRVWVTFRSETTEAALASESVYWAWGPTNRNIVNLLRNLGLALTVLLAERPDLVLTTGAGVAVPFLALGKVLGAKAVFVESITRVQTLSLSAKLLRPCLDAIYVHWPQLLQNHPKAQLIQSGSN
ncbi:MAG: UDP-N-acetylglucosamine--LPS N-acetylglucosamine transferase [Synechococcus sp.]